MELNIYSQITKYEYKIQIREPRMTKESQPIYFILDGSWYYPYFRTMFEKQSINEPKTHISDAWVVSIEHGEDIKNRRFNDFTLFADNYKLPPRLKANPVSEMGGAAKFHRFLKEELMPFLLKVGMPNNEKIIFGHSLSGLYVCYEVFLEDCLFNNGIAFSPSLWWNDHQIFKEQVTLKQQAPLYIAVGEQEGFMVKDAEKYYTRLAQSRLFVAAEENHASIVPTAMSRACRYFYMGNK